MFVFPSWKRVHAGGNRTQHCCCLSPRTQGAPVAGSVSFPRGRNSASYRVIGRSSGDGLEPQANVWWGDSHKPKGGGGGGCQSFERADSGRTALSSLPYAHCSCANDAESCTPAWSRSRWAPRRAVVRPPAASQRNASCAGANIANISRADCSCVDHCVGWGEREAVGRMEGRGCGGCRRCCCVWCGIYRYQVHGACH